MKAFISFLLCIILFFSTVTTTYAQETPALTEETIGAVISPIQKGSPAPITGVIMSPEAIATIIIQIRHEQETIALEVAKATAIEKARSDYELAQQKNIFETDKKILSAQLEEKEQNLKQVEQQLQKEVKDRPNLSLWVGIGALTGVGITILTVFAVSKATK